MLGKYLPQDRTTLKICFSHGNTSEDERLPASDGESSDVFKVMVFEWRNVKVTEFLHAIDARIRSDQNMRKESQMRLRHVSKSLTLRSTRPAPQGLPKDWYDAAWLLQLEETDPLGYAELRVAPAVGTDWDALIK